MYQHLAQRFTELLQPSQPPIGLAFTEGIPTGIEHKATRVPSACTFWRLAERGVFYATAEDHQECPIGMMTMGFTMPQSAQERAQALVQTMANVQYFSPTEVSALPIVKKIRPNIIITDMQMPKMSGSEFITALKAQPETADIPIVIVAGKNSGFKAKEHRANFAIFKDIDIESQLSKALDAVLSNNTPKAKTAAK